MLLALSLSVCSCKKSSDEGSSGNTEKQNEVNNTGDSGSVQEAKPDTSVSGEVPIAIKLPKPLFVGTPQPTRVTHLERPLGKARPPFYAPVGTKNVALGKPVTSTDEYPIIGTLEMVTDGDKEAADGSYVELGPLVQHITIDLGAEYDIYAVLLWHYHKQARVYFDVVIQVADDPDFITNVRALFNNDIDNSAGLGVGKDMHYVADDPDFITNVSTLFNNDIDNSAGLGVGKDMHYVETNEGRLIDARSARGRYVRLYSNGNSSNELNHYIEVEVFGKPAK
jgi:hypothetical protein